MMVKAKSRDIEQSCIYVEQGVIKKARYGSRPVSYLGKVYVFDKDMKVSKEDVEVIKKCGAYRNVLVSNESSGYFNS